MQMFLIKLRVMTPLLENPKDTIEFDEALDHQN